MAGVSTKEIKNRIRSMESTKQITKAMEMVAASKLRRAQTQVLNSRPYFETLYSTIQDIAGASRDMTSPYMTERPVKKTAFVVIAGDRGLAGGYNSKTFTQVEIKPGMTGHCAGRLSMTYQPVKHELLRHQRHPLLQLQPLQEACLANKGTDFSKN